MSNVLRFLLFEKTSVFCAIIRGLFLGLPTRAQFFECGSPNLHSQSIVSAGPPSPSTQKASVADATLAVNLQFTVNTVKPHACN